MPPVCSAIDFLQFQRILWPENLTTFFPLRFLSKTSMLDVAQWFIFVISFCTDRLNPPCCFDHPCTQNLTPQYFNWRHQKRYLFFKLCGRDVFSVLLLLPPILGPELCNTPGWTLTWSQVADYSRNIMPFFFILGGAHTALFLPPQNLILVWRFFQLVLVSHSENCLGYFILLLLLFMNKPCHKIAFHSVGVVRNIDDIGANPCNVLGMFFFWPRRSQHDPGFKKERFILNDAQLVFGKPIPTIGVRIWRRNYPGKIRDPHDHHRCFLAKHCSKKALAILEPLVNGNPLSPSSRRPVTSHRWPPQPPPESPRANPFAATQGQWVTKEVHQLFLLFFIHVWKLNLLQWWFRSRWILIQFFRLLFFENYFLLHPPISNQ